MKALFITKPFYIEPLGPMYLIAAAKRAGFAADLVTTDEDIDAKIREFKPDVLCYSILTGDQNFYDKLNQELFEKHKIYGIAGGPHCTFFPEFIKTSSFMCICRGEGEEAFVQFLSGDWDSPLPSNFETSSSFKAGHHWMRPLIEDLDTVAFPNRACVFKYPHIYNGPIKHFIAGRGCLYNCTYCFNAAYAEVYKGKGKRIRLRSPDNLIEEIKEVMIASPIELVYFQDDTFNGNINFLREFTDRFLQEINTPFHCHIRLNLINEEIVKLLAKAGCTGVHAAIESGDEVVRCKILNRHMSDECILNGIRLLKQYGIKVMTQNILGLPFTTIDDDIKTLKLNQLCKPTYAWASIFQPYPRTLLGERAKKAGYYTGDFSDIGSNFFDKTPLNLPEMHKTQIANLQKLFAVAVELPEFYPEEVVHETICKPGFAEKPEIIEGYRRFRKMKDEELYNVKL